MRSLPPRATLVEGGAQAGSEVDAPLHRHWRQLLELLVEQAVLLVPPQGALAEPPASNLCLEERPVLLLEVVADAAVPALVAPA